jgi:aminodeoxyfutalosine deaminase
VGISRGVERREQEKKMSLEQYLQEAPKAELHVHLEGTIQPATVLALAQRNNVSLPFETEEEFRQLLRYRDFDHFIEIFMLVTRCLKTSEDYEQVVYELGAEMARQHVHYAEVTVTPSTRHLLSIPQDIYFSGMQRGRARAQADFNIEINWIFNIVRQWVDTTRTWPMADYVTSVAIEGKDDGVVALGLAGAEADSQLKRGCSPLGIRLPCSIIGKEQLTESSRSTWSTRYRAM